MLNALLIAVALPVTMFGNPVQQHNPSWKTKVVVQYLENGVPKTKVEQGYSTAPSLEGCLYEVFNHSHLLWGMIRTIGHKQSKSIKLEGIGSICEPLRG